MPVPRERLVAAETLFVTHQAPRPGQTGSGILAIGSDGHVRWSWASESLLEPLVVNTTGELVVVGLSDDGFGKFPRGGLIAFDQQTGEVAWSIETALPASTILDTQHGLIAVTQDSSIFCD